jgi:hypothetical protein
MNIILRKIEEHKNRKYKSIRWSSSHGVDDKNLGAAEIYISLIRIIEPKNALVIGSGAGFVPYVILKNSDAMVTLVDAFIAETGNGSPMDFETKKSDFYKSIKQYQNRCFIINELSDYFFEFSYEEEFKFDLIFIDGDHSYTQVKKDFFNAKKILSDSGLIMFHDTNLPSVRKAANEEFVNWIDLKEGEGTGIFLLSNEIKKTTLPINNQFFVKKIAKLKTESRVFSDKWNYLQHSSFEERFQITEKILSKYIEDGASFIEIGGNPNPFSHFLFSKGYSIESINIEPHITEQAIHKFNVIKKNGGRILDSLDEVKNEKYDFFVFFGIDLSACESYKDFVAHYEKIKIIIRRANLVIIEAGNYQPSKILQELLAFNADIIFSKEFTIDLPENEISITKDILKRKVLIFKSTQVTIPKSVEDKNLIRVANYYALDGSPPIKSALNFIDKEIMIDEIAQHLNLHIESYENQHFVWLTNRLRIRLFSHNANSIVFKLLPGSFKPKHVNKQLRLSRIFYKINVYENELEVSLSNFSMFFARVFKNFILNINLPHYNPNKLTPPVKDSRNVLSYAVTSASLKQIK